MTFRAIHNFETVYNFIVKKFGTPGGPFTWISNYIHYKAWHEITYPFSNFNGGAVEVWKWVNNVIQHFIMDVITYPCW